MRNHYESEIGHFEGAITPDVDTFRDSLPLIEEDLQLHKKDKNIVMYCTGGIRCEKASAYFKYKGFENVYQLEGGIIEYTRQVKAQGLDNKFRGKTLCLISEDLNKFPMRLFRCVTSVVIRDTHVNCATEACICCYSMSDLCKET